MKRLKRIVFVLILLFIAFVVVLPYAAEIGIKQAVNRQAPSMVGVDVSLGGATVSPLSCTVGIQQLSIGNPEGFQTDRAAFLDAINVTVDLPSVISDVIIVKDIVIDGAELTYEIGTGGGNLIVIQRKLNTDDTSGSSSTSGESSTATGSESTADSAVSENKSTSQTSSKQIKVIVEHFILKNSTIRLSIPALEGESFQQPLPDLELTDIGKKEGGQTVKETLRQIAQQIVPLAVKTVKKNTHLSSQLMDYISRDAQSSGAEKSIKQVIEEKAEVVQEKVQEKAGELIDKFNEWRNK